MAHFRLSPSSLRPPFLSKRIAAPLIEALIHISKMIHLRNMHTQLRKLLYRRSCIENKCYGNKCEQEAFLDGRCSKSQCADDPNRK
jgi:hypothetical protein